ncbi:MAG TPA: hypothetical protein VH083_23035 [Myxococcales bacterium]|jgi:hypothetical protein|nr:hypothetical protein [Myxococcales bacterium]
MMRHLLSSLLPEGDKAPLLGDLDEEFLELVTLRGRASARRWYLRQCLLSIPPLMMARWRRLCARDWQLSIAAVLCFVLAPILAIELLRSFVLGQIPLKDDALRSPAFAGTLLAFTTLCSALASLAARKVPGTTVAVLAWLALSVADWPLPLWIASLPCLLIGTRAGAAREFRIKGD